MNITDIQTLIDTSRFEEAILATDKLTTDRQEGQLFKSLAYSMLGDFSLAESLANQVESPKLLLKFAVSVCLVLIKVFRGDYDAKQSMIHAHEKRSELHGQEDYSWSYWEAYLYFVEGLLSINTYNRKEVLDYIQRVHRIPNLSWQPLLLFVRFIQISQNIPSGTIDPAELDIPQLLQEISDQGVGVLEGYVLISMGATYLISGDFEEFKEYATRGVEIWRTIKFAVGDIYYHGAMGLYYLNTANLDEAMQQYRHALSLSDQLGTIFTHGSIYRFIGEIHYRRGELKEALVNYQHSLKIRVQSDDIFGMGESYSHLGKIHQEFGELELALDNYKKGLEIRESINFISGIAASCDLLGNVHLEMGKLQEANGYYSKGLVIKQRLGNDFSIASTLFNQIRIFLELDINKVDQLLNDLQTINKKLNNKQVQLYTDLAQALILKHSSRSIKKSQAQLILQSLAQQDVIDHQLSVLILVNLTDMLLWELKSSSDTEVLADIDEAVAKLLGIASSQNIPSLFVRTHLLQSKLAVLNMNFEDAKSYLHQAETIANNKGLRHLAIITSNQMDELLRQIETWGDLIRQKPVNELFELAQLQDLLQRTQLSVKDLETEPVLLLILADNGTTIFSHKFIELEIKENLVGSFLSAITAFGKETFSDTGGIERIIHHNYTILIQSAGGLMFCLIIKGNSYAAMQTFDGFIETVQASTIWHQLVTSPHKLEHQILASLETWSVELFDAQNPASNVETISESSEYLDVPTELLSYKFLLNPVRLSIIKVLNNYFRYPAADLRKILGVPWGTFNDHIEALMKKGYVETNKEFIEENARNILYLTSTGASEYTALKSILTDLIS